MGFFEKLDGVVSVCSGEDKCWDDSCVNFRRIIGAGPRGATASAEDNFFEDWGDHVISQLYRSEIVDSLLRKPSTVFAEEKLSSSVL